jgi:phospholipid/cholesterol/gamma-HCH transport system permease protein
LLVFLATLRRAAADGGVPFDDAGLPPAAARLMALSTEAVPITKRQGSKAGILSRVGQATMDSGGEAVEVMTLVGDTLLSGGRGMRGRVRMRPEDLMTCIHEAGAAALPIVTIVNVLIGGIVAFVGAVQLRRFGADIFVADLIGVAMIREMVSLMTAIIMSGRTGGAYAAHIATMLGNEEIDALRVIGVPINDYLILPRLLALTGMMPLLYLYGCAVGIFGGFVVTVAMLNVSQRGFIDEISTAVAGGQVVFGLVKSIAFGALIAIVGCRAGLRAGRSAADVGQAATKAVVAGIVGVIALDAIFAVCANALGF